MNINERHQHILEKLKKDSKVNILDLIEEMGVSGVTIRKDLKLLEDKHLINAVRRTERMGLPMTDFSFQQQRVTKGGRLLFSMMWLERIPSDDLRNILTLLAEEETA